MRIQVLAVLVATGMLGPMATAKAVTCNAGPDCTIVCPGACAAARGDRGICKKRCFPAPRAGGGQKPELGRVNIEANGAPISAVIKQIIEQLEQGIPGQ
jgi:hypothetical protein